MNRRKFLLSTTGGAAALCLPDLTLSTGEMPLNKKSLKYGMVDAGESVLEKFQIVAELGFDGIELDSPNGLSEDEILSAKESTGLEIPGVVNSVHWRKPLSHPDPSVRDECTASMLDALEKCRIYGGTTVLLVPAVVNEEVSYDEAWERSTLEIHKMLPHAKRTGVRIAIENVWNNFLLSPLEAAEYIDQFDSPYIGWYFDVGNVVRYGWPEQWIRILGKRIIKIDIKEYSRTKQRNEGIYKGFEVALGEGDCQWSRVNKALREVGYSGWGSAEVRGGDRERLKEIADRMDMIYRL